MCILVTGGAGFIGSNFIQFSFKESDETIVNFDALTYAGNPANLASFEGKANYSLVRGTILDRAQIEKVLIKFQPRAIIHFAAETHVDRSIHEPATFIETNILGSFNLIDSACKYWQSLNKKARNNFRFVHVSTDEVYGTLNPQDPSFTEDHKYSPNSPYSASKASSDHIARAYFHTYGFPSIITNCSNNYGPYQFPEKLIPLIIHNALSEKLLPIYGDGQQVRDWLYVADHCSAISAILKKGIPGETYNIGGQNEYTNLAIVQMICSKLDTIKPSKNLKSYHDLITFVEDRPGHDRRYAINNSKIEHEIGWAPKENFESGLQQTIEWYLDNANWVEFVTSGAYQNWIAKHYK